MKKFTSLMTVAFAASFSFGAFAQDPTVVELSNPSFEETTQDADGNDTNLGGWTIRNNSDVAFGLRGHQEGWNPTYNYVRLVSTSSSQNLGKGTYMEQTVPCEGNKLYVLSAYLSGDVNRKTPFNQENGEAAYFWMYDSEDGDELAGRGVMKLTSYERTYYGTPDGENSWQTPIMYYLFYVTDEAAEELAIGFGLPDWDGVNDIPVGCLLCDEFKLRKFDNTDIDAAKAWLEANETGTDKNKDNVFNPYVKFVKYPTLAEYDKAMSGESAVEGIEVAPVQDGKYYNLQGIEVAEPTTTGIYIHNGKKIFIRK